MKSLNHVYRLVWSGIHRMLVAVSEIAKSHTKCSGPSIGTVQSSQSEIHFSALRLTQKARLKVKVALATMVFSSAAIALPTGESVQSGSIASNVTNNGSTLQINQSSQSAIVNWQSFNIANHEAVNLLQPTGGMALFRVIGNGASEIYGQLTATGQLFLINPNGILFGPSSHVDVGSIVASTLNISDGDFLNARYHFSTTVDHAGKVVNQGVIKAADEGYIVLLSNTVDNSGTLVANHGSVVLGAAQQATLDFYGNGLIKTTLSGDALQAAIKNTGLISAHGGVVQIASNARSAAINVGGIVEVTSIVERDGAIYLEGGANSNVNVTGKLLANSDQTNGGTVAVTGTHVALLDGSEINVSGATGAGNVYVGGGYQGEDAGLQNATTTYVADGASIKADGTQQANGGQVIIWSDDTTRYYGSISAQGGATGGNGGFVEVSGKEHLEMNGDINVAASNGVGGKVLLDPKNINLVSGSGNTPVDTGGIDYNANTNTTPDPYVINIANVTGYSELSLKADQNITVSNNLIMGAGNDVVFNAGQAININATLQTTNNGANLGNISLTSSTLNVAAAGSILAGGNLNITTTGDVTAAGKVVVGGLTTFTYNGNSAANFNFNNTQNDFNNILFVNNSNNGANYSIEDLNGMQLSGTARTIFAHSTGDIKLNGNLVVTGQGNTNSNLTDFQTSVATPLALVTDKYFYDNGYGLAVTANTNNARWLVFASAPNPNVSGVNGGPYGTQIVNATGTNDSYDFVQYGVTYTNGKLVSGTGDGFVYAIPAFVLGGSVIKQYDGTTTVPLSQYGNVNVTLSSQVSGFTLNPNYTINSLSYLNKDVGTGKEVTAQVSNLSINGTPTDVNNRPVLLFTSGSSSTGPTTLNALIGTITPAPLTITANNQTKTYGDTFNFNGTQFSSLGLQNGETVTSVSLSSAGAVATANATTYPIIASAPITGANGFMASNYSISYVNGTFTVNPAALTITANNQSKTYGDAFGFNGTEFTASGLKNGNIISSVTLNSGATPSTANAGSYNIVASAPVGDPNSFMASNYTISYVNGIFTVNPAALTITANNQTKTYGDSFGFNGTEFSASGLKNGNTISTVSLNSGATPTTANVGSYGIVASAPVTGANGFNAGNYSISYVNGTFTVTPAALTITANNQTKTYGDTFTFTGTEFGTTGLKNGETVGSVTLTSNGAPATASVAGSPYSIVASNATGGTFNAGNYSVSYVNGAFTVTPAALTITANNQTKTYGDTFTFAGTEFGTSGLKNGETVGSVTLTSNGAPATANVAGSPYSIVASNATGGTFNAGNYNVTYVNGNFTVTPAALTITANNQTKTYGDTFTFAGTEFGTTGLKNGETVGSVTLTSNGAPATANVAGSPYSIVASNATGGTFNAGNYSVSYVNGTFTVNPAALTITANNQTKTYGDSFTFTGAEFGSTGLKNGETIASVNLTSAGAAATADVAGSPYDIIASNPTGAGFTASNYSISYVNGTFTVNPAALTITANNQTKTYGDTFTFAGTEFGTSGLKNGETVGSVALSSNGAPATASVAGSPYSIVASNATGGTFNAGNYNVTYVNGTFTVNPAALTITANNQTKVYGDTFTFTGSEFSSSGLKNGEAIGSVTLTSTGAAATANVAGNPYDILASNATGGTFNAGNYSISYVNGTFTVNPAALTITANNQTKTYGDNFTFAGTEFGSTGLKNGEAIASVNLTSTGAGATADVGSSPYDIIASNPTGAGFTASNYSITYVNGTFTVNPAALTITANNQTKTYGDTFTFAGTEFGSTGLKNGETIGNVALTSTGATATANVAGNPYDILASNATGGSFNAQNYTISYVNGTFTVDPAALTVALNNQTKNVGDTFVFNGTEYTSSGLKNGDNLGSLNISSLGSPSTAPAGNYAIQGNATGNQVAANYAITFVPGVMNVQANAVTPINPIDFVGLIREGGKNPLLNSVNIIPLNTAAGADDDERELLAQCPTNTDTIQGMPVINSGLKPPAGVVLSCI